MEVEGRLSDPDEPARFVGLAGVDGELMLAELPRVSKKPDPRKGPGRDPTDWLRTIKAVRDYLSLRKNRHCRYRRFLSATSARFPLMQYLFFRLSLP
jgi:hypothetical protein